MCVNLNPSTILSEEKIAVEYDYPSSSDENDSINTPSSGSTSSDTNTEVDFPSFIDSIPEPTADSLEVRDWVEDWFIERTLHPHNLDSTINKLYWNGHDIHNESKSILEDDLKAVGFKLYARRLALDIVEARGGDEKLQNPTNEGIRSLQKEIEQIRKEQQQLVREVKGAREKNFDEKHQPQVKQHVGKFTIARYILRFMVILLSCCFEWPSELCNNLHFAFLCTGGYLLWAELLGNLWKSLAEKAYAIEDQRRIQEHEKASKRGERLEVCRKKCKVNIQVELPSLDKVAKKQDKITTSNLDCKKKFLNIWMHYFFIYLMLHLFGTSSHWAYQVNLFCLIGLFTTSNEGIILLYSATESIGNIMGKFSAYLVAFFGIEQEQK